MNCIHCGTIVPAGRVSFCSNSCYTNRKSWSKFWLDKKFNRLEFYSMPLVTALITWWLL